VKKVFRVGTAETHALRDVSLEVHQGEYVAISGPSGCGKSTLLSILGLLDAPTTGEYHLGGRPVDLLGPDERALARGRQLGFVFQAFNLIGDLTAYENVELPLTYRDMSEAERKRRVWEALERVGMADRVNNYPSQLSGGQQQRVAVARAIAGRPLLLLADEPSGNLDSANGDAVMALLTELHGEGATIIMVTHDPRYADHAERTLHLLDGVIIREDRSDSGARKARCDMKMEP
jgi:putative ABC transport system ATP-binding protein